MIQQPLGRLVVVCEGAGDKSFVHHLLDRRGVTRVSTAYPEGPKDPGGRQGFSSILRTIRTLREFPEVLGVLLISDNDTDPGRSFAEVQAQLEAAEGYAIPDKPEDWKAPVSAGPLVAVYMMPRMNQEGDLETLCLEAARAQWPETLRCADEFAICTGANSWPSNKRSKMLLRCVLSATCRTDPNTTLVYLWSRGTAGVEFEINLEHETFDDLTTFANGLPTGNGPASTGITGHPQ